MRGEARVVMSERLGAIGDIERVIATETGAELVSAPLWTEADLMAYGDADVLIVGASEPVTAAVLAGLPGVRCIVRRGVGVDNVDVPAATREGIPVAYIPDASVEEVSDHALALLLGIERGLFEARRRMDAGDTTAAGTAVSSGRRFADLTLGVVGLGRIGRALARKARGVFGTILACDPAVTVAPDGVTLVPPHDLLARADLLSLHAPGGGTILDRAAFRRMKPGAVVVNTARGALIDEAALLDALDNKTVRAAALDVTAIEPLPADSPLRGRPDVVLLGHTAAKGTRSSIALREGVVAATIAALRGLPPRHLADPSVLDTPQSRLRVVAGGRTEGEGR